MRLHAAWVFALGLAGCSLVYSDDRYRGSDGGSRDASVGDAGSDAARDCATTGCPGGQRCLGGECVSCDADGDGFAAADATCSGSVRDCDDGDAAVYPGAPSICGDGRVNACAGTGLEVRDEVRSAFGGTEIGAIPAVVLDEAIDAYFDAAQIAPIRGSDGVARVVVVYARTSRDGRTSNAFVRLLDGGSLSAVETLDLSTVAQGFFVTAARSLDDGGVRVAALRFGSPHGELYRGVIAAGATDLSGLTLARRDSAGTCLLSGGGFALPRYPFTALRIDGSGAVGGYNRYNEAAPYFRFAPNDAVACRGGGTFTFDTIVGGGPGTFAFTDDNPSNTTVTVWNGSTRDNTFQAGLGLSTAGDRSMDFIGIESGSDTERSLLVAPAEPNGIGVVPIDCRVPALGAECNRYAMSTRYVPAGGVTLSEPTLRRLTNRTGVLMWVEDRIAGATPPNTRVQELVAHVTDRDGRIPYANASDAGSGLPVLRYEFDDSVADHRLVKSMDAALLRDPVSGDLMIYAVGIYSQAVVSISDPPAQSEIRISAVRICATE